MFWCRTCYQKVKSASPLVTKGPYHKQDSIESFFLCIHPLLVHCYSKAPCSYKCRGNNGGGINLFRIDRSTHIHALSITFYPFKKKLGHRFSRGLGCCGLHVDSRPSLQLRPPNMKQNRRLKFGNNRHLGTYTPQYLFHTCWSQSQIGMVLLKKNSKDTSGGHNYWPFVVCTT